MTNGTQSQHESWNLHKRLKQWFDFRLSRFITSFWMTNPTKCHPERAKRLKALLRLNFFFLVLAMTFSFIKVCATRIPVRGWIIAHMDKMHEKGFSRHKEREKTNFTNLNTQTLSALNHQIVLLLQQQLVVWKRISSQTLMTPL